MQMLSFGNPFGPPGVQARYRGACGRRWGLTELVRELAGLAGLLGWLGVLFYLIALLATGTG